MVKAVLFDFDGVIHDTSELAYKMIAQVYPDFSMDECRNILDSNVYENKAITKELVNKFLQGRAEEYKKLKIENDIKEELLKVKEKLIYSL